MNTLKSWVLAPAAIIAAPALAVAASCADVLLIMARRGDQLVLTSLATIPLSLAAGAWTFFMLLRLRREVLRRDEAEAALRSALSQRERALDRELSVRRELDHRVRNNLAGLVGLVAVYERSGRGPAQLGQAIRTKIEAMRAVHDIAGRAGGEPIDLQSLLALVAESIVPLQRRTSLVFGGPQVPVATSQAAAMAMVLQELTTNSIKHGALAAPEGKVRVHWTTKPDGPDLSLTLHWREQGLPAPAPPREGAGVGLGLISGFARSDLRGEFHALREPDAWSAELRAVLSPAPAESALQESCA